MAHRPNLSPGQRNSAASGPEGVRFEAEDLRLRSGSVDSESDIAALFAKFEQNSGGTLSPQFSADLALEIVLNEIVEQACLATRASGAAVVLRRADELVCRASTGPTAPTLGAQMDARSGLSGLCLQTGQVQRCDDTQTDPRADPEASRRLGVRSVMVVPLARPTGVLGILEVMSERTAGFGERDERTLAVLAGRVLRNVERAADPFLLRAGTQVSAYSANLAAPQEARAPQPAFNRPGFDQAGFDERGFDEPGFAQPGFNRLGSDEHGSDRSGFDNSDFERSEFEAPAFNPPLSGPIFGRTAEIRASRSGTDLLTALMGLILLAAVVLLGVLTGRRLGWNPANWGAQAAKVSSRATPRQPDSGALAGSATGDPSDPLSSSVADPALPGASAAPSSSASQPAVSADPAPSNNAQLPQSGVPAGALRVYENGREVFRLPASHRLPVSRPASPSQASVMDLSPAAAEASVIHRVEPEYPEQARSQQLQGKVVLKLRVGPDGAVDDIQLVSGEPVLAQAAINAVTQWRFKPREGSGDRAEMQTVVTLNFRLPQ